MKRDSFISPSTSSAVVSSSLSIFWVDQAVVFVLVLEYANVGLRHLRLQLELFRLCSEVRLDSFECREIFIHGDARELTAAAEDTERRFRHISCDVAIARHIVANGAFERARGTLRHHESQTHYAHLRTGYFPVGFACATLFTHHFMRTTWSARGDLDFKKVMQRVQQKKHAS